MPKKKTKPKAKKTTRRQRQFAGLIKSHPGFNVTVLGLVAIGLCLLGYYLLFVGAETSYNSTGGRPFSSASPFNSKVPSNPQLDSNSSAVAGAIISHKEAGGTRNGYVNLVEFVHPVYFATGSDPKYTIVCKMNWGTCPFAGTQVSIPVGAAPGSNSDAPLNIVNLASGKSYEFWQAETAPRTDGRWYVSWGGTSDLNGDGSNSTGSSTGANISRLAGLVRPSEIAAGNIPHALTMSTDASCGPNNSSNFRYPARKTDGKSSISACVAEGGRVYLQMTQDELDAIPGLNKAEKTFAKALAEYGAFNIDNGGNYDGTGISLNLGVEKDLAHPNLAPGNPFYDAGMTKDGYSVFTKLFAYLIKNDKTDRLRYLAPQWNKDGSKTYAWEESVATSSPVPTVTSTPTPISTPTSVPTPTPTPTPTPIPKLSPTPTPTSISVPTPTPTPPPVNQPVSITNLNRWLAFDWIKGKYYIQLSWKNTGGPAANYLVFAHDNKANPLNSLVGSTGGSTELRYYGTQPNGLRDNTTYSMSVVGINQDGDATTPSVTTATTQCFLIFCSLK